MAEKIAVIAIGGNSLVKDKAHQSVEDQYQAIKETSFLSFSCFLKKSWSSEVLINLIRSFASRLL